MADVPSQAQRSSPDAGGGQTALAEAARLGLRPGLRVGLFGGSFNPAHSGHLAVSDAARRQARLDRVVWLVSPQSPLKRAGDYLPRAARIVRARRLTAGRPWLAVTDIEAALGTRYTADTLARLEALSRARLVWIMGADSLAGFHRWRDWRGLARRVPMLVVSRPGGTMGALKGEAARTLASRRLTHPAVLAAAAPPAWCYLHTVHDPASATAIRRRGSSETLPAGER